MTYTAVREKKALAIHIESGRTFWWDGQETVERAEQLALEGCQQQYGDPCVLLAGGAELLAPDPREAPRHDMERLHYRGRYDVDKVPFLKMTPDLRNYPDLPDPKAMAVRPQGARSIISSGAGSIAEAERKALAACNSDHAPGPCFLYASGNQVVLPDRRIDAQR